MNPLWGACRKSAPIRNDEWLRTGPEGAAPAAAVKWMIAMRNLPLSTRLRHVLLACTAVIALGCAGAQAQTQADDDEDTFEQKVIKNILGGLGVDVGRPGIDYRERSPLVIPPTLDLPPPQSADLSAVNPAWPREPQQQRRAAYKPNARATTEDPGTTSTLTPDELRRGTNPRAPRAGTSGSVYQDELTAGRPMRPSELGSGNFFSWHYLTGGGLQESATFTGEPARGALTQPPPGYQTPSPSYPYAAGQERGGGWKIPSILDRPVGSD